MALEEFNEAAKKLGGSPKQGAVERVFVLRSRIGRNIYVIRRDRLEITHRVLGANHESHIPIKSISPEYDVRGARVLRSVILLLVPVALCVIVMRVLANIHDMPDEALWFPAQVGFVYLIAAIKFFPRFEWFEFKNHFGRVIFTILREPGQREECEEFIHALLDRIEAGDQDIELPSIQPVDARQTEPSKDVPRWILAIALSLFAVVVPPTAVALGEHGDFFVIVPTVIGSGGAIVSAIYSFIRKEPHRLWALVAAIVALVPVFFY